MTEAEWLASSVIRSLGANIGSLGSHRKRILFACACCRLVWDLLPDHCYLLAEAVERYADRQSRPRELVALFKDYFPHQVARPKVLGANQAAEAIGYLGWRWRWGTGGLRDADGWTIEHVARSAAEALAKTILWKEARRREAELLRDIFGNPFRAILLNPRWLRWNERTIPKMAQTIYEDRAFDRLPILERFPS